MDSLERQFRANAFENTRLFNNAMERSTVYTRVEALGHPDRLVGFAWHALKEAVWSEYADRLLIIDYDLLATSPEDTLALIYEFLHEPPFQHDFQSIDYDAPQFDLELGLVGLHTVRPKVEHRMRKTILPPDLFDRYADLSFWLNMPGSRARTIIQQPSQELHKESQIADRSTQWEGAGL
jgi:sulfotransferase